MKISHLLEVEEKSPDTVRFFFDILERRFSKIVDNVNRTLISKTKSAHKNQIIFSIIIDNRTGDEYTLTAVLMYLASSDVYEVTIFSDERPEWLKDIVKDQVLVKRFKSEKELTKYLEELFTLIKAKRDLQ